LSFLVQQIARRRLLAPTSRFLGAPSIPDDGRELRGVIRII